MSYYADDAPHRHLRCFAADLAFSDFTGRVLVAGQPTDEELTGLAMVASSWVMTDLSPTTVEAIAARVEERFSIAVDDDDGGPVDALFLAALPRNDPVGRVEEHLERVADGGPVIVALSRTEGPEHLVEELVRACCGGTLVAPPEAPVDRLVRLGTRRGGRTSGLLHEVLEVLPITVVLWTEGISPWLEQTLCDLLLRCSYVPSRLFVMDDAAEGEPPVPEDLFQLPVPVGTQVAIVPTGGVGLAAAVNDALGGVEDPFTLLIDRPCRIAPNGLVTLGIALEAHELAGAVVGASVTMDARGTVRAVHAPCARPDGVLASLLADQEPPLGGVLFRTEALRKLSGVDPESGAHGGRDLLLRAALLGDVVAVNAPIVGALGRVARAPSPSWAAAVQQQVGVKRLARSLVSASRDRREDAARELLAGFLVEQEAFALALAMLDSVAGDDALALKCLAERRSGQAAASLARLEALGRTSHPGLLIEEVLALAALGHGDDALHRLGRLERRHPDLEVARWVRLQLEGANLSGLLELRRLRGDLPLGVHVDVASR